MSATGDVYVADTQNNRIQELDSSGNFLRAWGKDVISGGGTGFEVCTVAAECKAGEPGGLGGELSEPAGLAVGPEAVYVADTQNNRIQEFSLSGGFVRTWGENVINGGGTEFEICEVAAECKAGEPGAAAGQFNFPAGIAVSGAGNVYVADTAKSRIQEFSPIGEFVRTWGKDVISGGGTGFEICELAPECKNGEPGGLGGEVDVPTGIAIDLAENVYVGDTQNNRVQAYDSEGNFLAAWGKDVISGGGTGFEVCTVAAECKTGEPGGLGGEFSEPAGLGVDATGSAVYVADTLNDRGQAFKISGTFLAAAGKDVISGGGTGFEVCTVATECKAGEPGGLGGELDAPLDLATDPSGVVYAADTANNRIQKAIYQTDTFLAAWGRNVGNEAATPAPSPSPTPAPSPTQVEPGSLPAPTFAKTVNAEPVSGTVLIKRRGSGRFQVLSGAQQIPVGSTIDATRGRIRLTSAKNKSGATETADFYSGVFSVLQPPGGKPTTELKLIDNLSAAGRRLARSSALRASRKSHSSNGLWGSGHGNYVTNGHYGSATVRGTVWLTEDRPGGTFFEAKKDTVLVRDFTRHRTILLHTGQRYLAPAR